MRSSSRADVLAVVLALFAVLGIAQLREPLAQSFVKVKTRADTYLLPSPHQTYLASLGYRAALADLIFGHVLVSYGLHFQEKRRFEIVGEYLEVINQLDPKFRAPYLMADTLLTLQPEAPPLDYYRRARAIQERGLRELPNDQELWNTSGQFLAYLAHGQLTDQAEKQEYRRTGIKYLMRACELMGSNQNIPYNCVTAANLLNAQGERDAAKNFLQRVMTLSDDPKLQELAGGFLRRVVSEQADVEIKARLERFRQAWHGDLAFSPRAEIVALGPRFDAAGCAGLGAAARTECATSWLSWGAPPTGDE